MSHPQKDGGRAGPILVLLTLALLVFPWQGRAAPTTQPMAQAGIEVTNMQYVGEFAQGYIGNELYLQPAYAIVGHDGGVSVLKTSSPGSPTTFLHRETPSGFPEDITADGGLVYAVVGRPIGLGGDYLEVYVRNEVSKTLDSLGRYFPPLVEGYPITGLTGIDKFFSPDYVYLGATTGLIVVDMFDKEDGLYKAAGFAPTDVVRDMVLAGNNAYLATDTGLEIVSVGSPTSPAKVGMVALENGAQEVAVVNGYAFLATGYLLHVIDARSAANPKLVRTITLAGDNVRDMAVEGNFLYMARGNAGVEVWFVGNPAQAIRVGKYDDSAFGASGVEVFNRLVFASAGGEGLKILHNTAPQPAIQVQAVDAGTQVNGVPLPPGTSAPLNPLDQIVISGGGSVELSGDCEQDIAMLLLTHHGPPGSTPATIIPQLLDAYPDLCATLSAARNRAAAATPSRFALTVESGSVTAAPRLPDLTLALTTTLASVTSTGLGPVTVAHTPATPATRVTAFGNGVTILLASDEAEPLELPAGASVEITAAGFGPVTETLAKVYLPMTVR